MSILVTGGAGFIGSNYVINKLNNTKETIVVIDALTYASEMNNLKEYLTNPRLIFILGNIADTELVSKTLYRFNIDTVVNFAAETHVDNSIKDPDIFVDTNIVGTFNLLKATHQYWQQLPVDNTFKFLHVSTDEVYGSLGADDPAFTETTAYAPNSPYAASKASSDHLVRAYYHTYGLPVLTTNCSNNYGPRQYPEKLIPLCITRAITGESLPIYGDGMQIRDWLHVDDHCSAIDHVLQHGVLGETYNIGGNNQKTNISIVKDICEILDSLLPKNGTYLTQIEHVSDRLGHDVRYAINPTKMNELGWKPTYSFDNGLEQTIRWYLEKSK